MANSAGTLEIVSRELGLALTPLETRLTTDNVELLIEDLGLRLPPGLTGVAALAGALADAATTAADLPAQVAALIAAINADDLGRIIGDSQTLTATIVQTVSDLASIGTALESAGNGFAGLTPDQQAQIQSFSQEFPQRLLQLLLVDYIQAKSPQLLHGLRLAGVVEISVITVTPPDPMRPSYVRKQIHPARFLTLLTDPRTHLRTAFGWRENDFDGIVFLTALKDLLEQELGLPAELLVPEGLPATLEAFLLAVHVTNTAPPGLQFDFRFPATRDFELDFPLNDTWEMSLDTRARFVTDLSAQLQPPLSIQFNPPSGAGNIDLALEVGRQSNAGPLILFGKAGGSRLEAGDIRLGLGTSLDWVAGASPPLLEPLVTAELVDGLLRISGEGGDSLIDEILGDTDIESRFAFELRWSPSDGMQFKGSVGLDIDIPAHAKLGPIRIDMVHLGLGLIDTDLRLDIGTTVGAGLGPIQATVERFGIRGLLSFPDKGGNLGPLQLDLEFLLPRGVALGMDTATVKLGGFLSIDPDNHRYAGAVELVIADSFSLTAIGLITTRFPDGSKGFSMLFIIAMRFPSPIPLGYNFYLSGVGGLLGLHRSVDIDRLRNGLQQGTVDDILFPEDVVANMNALVTDLREIFPATRDQFLVGPMAEISWSTPPLFTAEVGLIIEFSNPVRIAILGVLRVAVPNKDNPIVDLKVNFLGTIDFDKGLLAFDASIYDSFIGYGSFKFSFEGDMALRICWGKQPDFLTSVGGFHPAYTPPKHLALPTMKRLTLSILKDNPRLTLTSYFAITTNTVQFGAGIDFYFGVSGFKVIGEFAFDVLFQFAPFRFVAAVRASLSVKAGSAHILTLGLAFELSGTSPWNAKGTASFRILFIKVKVKFNKTWGERKEINLPTIEVLPELLEEFARNENWTALLSDLAGQQAILLPESLAADSLLFDPGGMLSISQNRLPLGNSFNRFGNSLVADISSADVAEVRVGARVLSLTPATEQFAPAALNDMKDAAKLAAPSYEQMKSGVRADGGDRLFTDQVLTREVRHERLVSDNNDPEPLPYDLNPELFHRLAPGGAVGRSALSGRHTRENQNRSVLDVTADHQRFSVVSSSTLRAANADSVELTRSEAEEQIKALVEAGGDRAEFDIIPAFQMAS